VSPAIPGAAALADGRAVLFTTARVPPDVPRAPTQLTARAIGNLIRLRWRSVHEDVQGNPLTDVRYNVYRGEQSDFLPDSNSLITTVTDTTYTETLDTALRYFYLVQAVTGGGFASGCERGFR
jgi:hypothetical protein